MLVRHDTRVLRRVGHSSLGGQPRWRRDGRRGGQRAAVRDVHVTVQSAGGFGHEHSRGYSHPQPCQPVLSPWSPGSARVTVGEVSALDDSSQCNCTWGGVVTVSDAGQTTVSDQ